MAFIFADLRRVLATTANIDAQATGAGTIYTVPPGRSAVIEKVVVRCTFDNTISIPATAQIETSAFPGSGNVFASDQWTGLLATGDDFVYDLRGKSVVLAPGAVVQLNITVGATGLGQTVAIDVVGYPI